MRVLTLGRSLGYFDPADSQPYRQLGWTDVNTQDAQNLAYQSAVEGSVLLKNDGTLPLTKSIQKLAFIGPWANTTT
jgi:beta-D-xylosidase 4